MTVVSGPGDNHLCRISTRSSQYSSRNGGNLASYVSKVNAIAGSISGRSICHQTQQLAATVHQLEPRSLCNSRGCSPHTVGGLTSLCLPFLLPDWEVCTQGQGGRSHNSLGGSCAVNSGVVSTAPGDADGSSIFSTNVHRPA